MFLSFKWYIYWNSSCCPRWWVFVWWLVLLFLYTIGISTWNPLLYVGLSLLSYVSYINGNIINYIKLHTKLFFFGRSITDKSLTRLYSLSNMVSVLKETGTAYPWDHRSGFLVRSVLLIVLVFCVVFLVLCVLFVFVLNIVLRVSRLSISVWFSLTFIRYLRFYW